MWQLWTVIPAIGRPAGSYIASKLKLAIGRKSLHWKWKNLINEAMLDSSRSQAEIEILHHLSNISEFTKIHDMEPDELMKFLMEKGLSEETANYLIKNMRLYTIYMAKNHTQIFYDYVIEAERKQLDGIQDIKDALGLDNAVDIRQNPKIVEQYFTSSFETLQNQISNSHNELKNYTVEIMENQGNILSRLDEVRRQLDRNNSRNHSIREPIDVANSMETNQRMITDAYYNISHAFHQLNKKEFTESSLSLFQASRLLYNLYRTSRDIFYYHNGNRCFALGKILRDKTYRQGEVCN